MARLPLAMQCGRYDRMEALRSGAVQAEAIDLAMAPPGSDSCDIRELSLAAYLRARAAGDCPFIALPVFPRRHLCHGLLFGRVAPGEPAQLSGTRIGVARDREDAGLWSLSLLQEESGLDPASLDPVAVESDQLAAMLRAGEIDAACGARLAIGNGIERLFADWAARDRAAWRATGIFPIMSVLVLRDSVHARHPWVAESLFKACEAAKAAAIRQMRFSGALSLMLPWLLDEIDEMDALFADDPWPYGLAANRTTLAAMAQLLHARGAIDKPLEIEPLFTPIVAWAE
jgi:4,5-dihydroxyphthalate decarboxylase